jgi:hypothetical protein
MSPLLLRAFVCVYRGCALRELPRVVRCIPASWYRVCATHQCGVRSCATEPVAVRAPGRALF